RAAGACAPLRASRRRGSWRSLPMSGSTARCRSTAAARAVRGGSGSAQAGVEEGEVEGARQRVEGGDGAAPEAEAKLDLEVGAGLHRRLLERRLEVLEAHALFEHLVRRPQVIEQPDEREAGAERGEHQRQV